MNKELKGIWKETVLVLFITTAYALEAEKNHENPQSRYPISHRDLKPDLQNTKY
jgi:hypothetical protein